jgi:hypothetical protein
MSRSVTLPQGVTALHPVAAHGFLVYGEQGALFHLFASPKGQLNIEVLASVFV